VRRGLLAAVLLVLAASPAPGQEAFPSRPVQLVVPYPPGGNTDLMARALQPELATALGQPVVVTNRGGAAGTIGTAEVARARPDGYVAGLVPNNPLTAQPHLANTGYDIRGFRFVCLVYDNPQVLVAGRGAPFRDGREMLEHARSAPEALVLGSPGQGSTQHILAADLLRRAGARPLHVPFTGAGPMAQAALGGQIHAFVESPSIPAATGLPVLAVFGPRRLPSLPEVPTTAELGHPVEGTSAGGLVAPAGIPEAAFARLQSACERSVGSDGFRAAAERLNAVPRFLPGEAFRARFAAESEANRDLLRALDLARD
jgi:tripartite-type tricarboxylate transporter receptor subunit TctC